ncbi:YjcZ family sporulation protein [Bacillus pinisoli]
MTGYENVAPVTPGYGYAAPVMTGYGTGHTFTLIVVLFILLIIVGAAWA